MKKIIKIWFYDVNGKSASSEVGKHRVKSITEHRPMGDGDKWYYDVEFDDRIERVFEFIRVAEVSDENIN